jgi:hypothetical protein
LPDSASSLYIYRSLSSLDKGTFWKELKINSSSGEEKFTLDPKDASVGYFYYTEAHSTGGGGGGGEAPLWSGVKSPVSSGSVPFKHNDNSRRTGSYLVPSADSDAHVLTRNTSAHFEPGIDHHSPADDRLLQSERTTLNVDERRTTHRTFRTRSPG